MFEKYTFNSMSMLDALRDILFILEKDTLNSMSMLVAFRDIFPDSSCLQTSQRNKYFFSIVVDRISVKFTFLVDPVGLLDLHE